MKNIFSLEMTIKACGTDATVEMQAWFEVHRMELETAVRERVLPKATELIYMEMRELGFEKAFPKDKS